MATLRAVFFIQLVLMAPVFIFFLATPASLGTVFLIGGLLPVGAIAALVAVWHGVRHPARRPLALATLVTAIVCIATPFVMDSADTGPVPTYTLVVLAIGLLVGVSLFVLAKSRRWSEDGSFARTNFNTRLLGAMGMLFVLFWFPAIGWLASLSARERVSNVNLDTLITTAAYYYVPVAGIALCLALFSLVYAPVGLFRNAQSRGVHALQLLVALMLMASLAAGAAVLAIFMVNPG